MSFVHLFCDTPHLFDDDGDIMLSSPLSPPTLLESHIDQLLKQAGHSPLRQMIAAHWVNQMVYNPNSCRYVSVL